jgi:hypothetical protein
MKHSMVDAIIAATVGGVAMYVFDPQTGRRRRSMLRDQFFGRGHDVERFLRRRVRWTGDRLYGAAAQARAALDGGEPASDRRIADRVRAAMGRVVSAPGAIDVNVAAGNVLLTGHVMAGERDRLLAAVADVQGVERVSDQLAAYDEPGRVPELQGAGRT